MWWSKNPQRATARLGFCGTRSAEQALSIYRLLSAGFLFLYNFFYFFMNFLIYPTRASLNLNSAVGIYV
jgi:hypothetical protein